MKVAIIQGTRPEIIKNYSVVKALRLREVPHCVLHTNQHHSEEMCDRMYAQMQYAADYVLPGTYRIGTAIDWVQQTLIEQNITQVIVNGDTAASIVGALAAMYLDLPVAHIEAGLRSRDPLMYEERNRIMVDAIATSLFAYTPVEQQLLNAHPDIRGAVYLEGNTTVDVLHDFADQFTNRPATEPYVFVTMHRKEFTDSAVSMKTVFTELAALREAGLRVLFALHPRTRDAAARHAIHLADYSGIEFIDPQPFFQAIALQKHAQAVITDSGCIQEEAYLLGVRCVTIRDNTERQLTVTHGANVVTGFSADRIRTALQHAISAPLGPLPDIYGSAGAGLRIVDRLI